jgi:hypothetical protein
VPTEIPGPQIGNDIANDPWDEMNTIDLAVTMGPATCWRVANCESAQLNQAVSYLTPGTISPLSFEKIVLSSSWDLSEKTGTTRAPPASAYFTYDAARYV